MNLQYAYTILYVTDVARTLAFYQAAFGFEQKLLTPEGDYGELASGATTIAFASIALAEDNLKQAFTPSQADQKPLGVSLTFTTPEVETQMQHALDHGAIFLAAPQQKPWGQTVGYVRDINGLIIEIATPMQ